MSQPKYFTWPAASTTAISALQTTVGADNLLINGSMAFVRNNTASPYLVEFDGYSRNVSLTSTNNLSAVDFTIVGTYRGEVVSETRVGPNNNTVYTAREFDTVTEVSVDAAVTAVSVGTGLVGNIAWQLYDYNIMNESLSIQVDVTGSVTYSFIATLDDVQYVSSPTSFTPITAMTSAATSQLGTTVTPFRYYTILISAGTGSLGATFIQQGTL